MGRCGALTASVIYLKLVAFPEIDSGYSARSLWSQISDVRSTVCIEEVQRSWRYGLNYYSVEPLPDCEQSPSRLHIAQAGGPPAVVSAR